MRKIKEEIFMNMKKLMAVVLAVAIAISAMAVNVFAAETYRIDLKKTETVNTGKTITWTFDFNIYNLFGYADQNSYLELVLPDTLTKKDSTDAKITWYIEVNGTRTQLQGIDAGTGAIDPTSNNYADQQGVKYFRQYVNFGAFNRPYYNFNGTDYWATIAQSQMVGDIGSMKLVAEMTYEGQPAGDNSMPTGQDWREAGFKTNNYDMYVQLWTAGADGVKGYGAAGQDDKDVTGSNIAAAFMTVAKSEKQNTDTRNVEFVNATEGEGGWSDLKLGNAFVWDHTLQNRAAVLGAESAKVIVTLDKTINGIALYTMRTADQPIGSYDTSTGGDNMGNPWPGYDQWYNPATVDVASTCFVNGETSQLVFDLPMDYLYDTTYGVYNGGIWITDRIQVDQFQWVNNDWYYNGKPIVFTDYATDIYIELTMPGTDDGDDTIDVDDPVEPGDVVTEPDGADDDIEVTDPGEDTNPPTGIVLAVLPMAIAAAAVVVSKRR